jgi:hypothetical protein
MREFAHVGIKPVGDLSTTANVLGRVLGELVFAKDTRGRYEEYPAYVAEHDGLRYALLGIPVPEDDLREVRTDDFELMVEPASPQGSDGVMADISNELILRIREDGRLECWSLGNP